MRERLLLNMQKYRQSSFWLPWNPITIVWVCPAQSVSHFSLETVGKESNPQDNTNMNQIYSTLINL